MFPNHHKMEHSLKQKSTFGQSFDYLDQKYRFFFSKNLEITIFFRSNLGFTLELFPFRRRSDRLLPFFELLPHIGSKFQFLLWSERILTTDRPFRPEFAHFYHLSKPPVSPLLRQSSFLTIKSNNFGFGGRQ